MLRGITTTRWVLIKAIIWCFEEEFLQLFFIFQRAPIDSSASGTEQMMEVERKTPIQLFLRGGYIIPTQEYANTTQFRLDFIASYFSKYGSYSNAHIIIPQSPEPDVAARDAKRERRRWRRFVLGWWLYKRYLHKLVYEIKQKTNFN